jgi:cobalt-zinc-cadmium efflux system outer membrane protein
MFNKSACLATCIFSLVAAEILPSCVFAQEPAESVDAPADTVSVVQFINVILDKHPVLHSADAAVEVARAQERSSDRPIYNPGLAFDAEDSVDKTVQIGVSQTIDWSKKKKAAHQGAGARRLSAEVTYQITRKELAAEALALLSNYWTGLELARLAKSSSDVMYDFSQQAELRYNAGDIPQVDYETAALAYAEVRMDQAVIAADLAEATQELIILGAPENRQNWPVMPRTLPTLATLTGDVDQLVAILPEVQDARAQVAAADADVELAKRVKKPDPTFGFRVGDEADERLLGFSFSIPLHVRNTFKQDVLASMSMRSQVEADAAEVERQTRARLLIAMERYALMRTGWTVWEKTGTSSIDRRAYALQHLWEAGEINTSEFLLQVRQTLVTQASAMELRRKLWNAWIEYLNASNRVEDWLQNAEDQSKDPVEQITMRNN